MKKSQILAAIALAMALGVVAPVMSSVDSAYAEEQKTDLQKAQEAKTEALANVKKDLGYTKMPNGATVSVYDTYKNAVDNIDAIASAVKDVKDPTKTTKTSYGLNSQVYDYLTTDTDGQAAFATLTGSIKNVFTTEAWTNANADGQYAVTESIIAALKQVTTPPADKDAAQKGIIKLQSILDGYDKAVADALDNVIKTSNSTNVAAIVSLVNQLSGLTGDKAIVAADIDTMAEYEIVEGQLEALLPKISLFRDVLAAEVALNGVTGNDEGVYLTAIANLEAAIKAFNNSQDETINSEATEDTKAPNTGIVGTAEGTATTVSIVAGLATALTALGAGVVAYRSARRK